jgi:glycosyltransferase involved in cell wall biosynthesis
MLSRRTASLVRDLTPRVVVAHHVEAAAATLASGARPTVFFAHTDLGAELPTYAHRSVGPVLSRAGRVLDAELCRRADRVAAISPFLRDSLSAQVDLPIAYVPPPWPVPPRTTDDDRRRARRTLGLADDERVILYAGNLDGYQGWPLLLAALAELPQTLLLTATASDDAPLRREALRAGVADRVRAMELPRDEPGRVRIHAAADVAVVPRLAKGGLPIKLLDALARGVPTVAARRAAAGLPLDGAAVLVEDDDPAAFAASVRVLLSASRATEELGARGRSFVRHAHAPARFNDALDALCDQVVSQSDPRNATRSSSSAPLR